ncbi:MAG TPA: ornithine cyclodeaminase family protein [Stellaceae bacterium]|nr:ornithine cyclodeaminase family protein [Stellaceae bacterium]
MTLFLAAHHIAALHESGAVGMPDYIEAVAGAYREQGEGRLQLLPRHNFFLDDSSGSAKGRSLKIAGAALPGLGAMGVPTYSAGFRRGVLNLWIELYSTETGEMLAIFHGGSLSPWKTGATAAVAARALAREDARILGIIGTGAQARTQVLGLVAVRPIAELRCCARSRDGREVFAAWAREALPGVVVRPVESAREAVEGVDILVTITTARDPVAAGDWLAPGTHCNVLGAHYPEAREVDTRAVQRSRVFVDDLDQAWGEKGELMIPLAAGEIAREHVAGDLGSVLAGKIAGRTNAREITMFCSGGTALEYVGVCVRLYERARAAGVGQLLDMRGEA